MIKKILLLLSAVLLLQPLFGQQLSSYNMFHLNRYMSNPAAAGTLPYIYVSAGYSRYWTGIKGAPSMQIVNAHSMVSQRVGVGAKVFNEDTGLSGKFGAEATYAYHLPVGSSGTKISFGLSAYLMQYRLNKDEFVVHDPDDDVIKYAATSTIVPDLSAGISFYQENKFFFDVASYQLTNRRVSYFNPDDIDNRQGRHYFIAAGYIFPVNENLRIEPSALIKLTEKVKYQIDAGIKMEIKKLFAVGCYYRTNDAILPYIGINTQKVSFGYSYGFVINDIAPYTAGSHEVMLVLKIDNAKSNLEKGVLTVE